MAVGGLLATDVEVEGQAVDEAVERVFVRSWLTETEGGKRSPENG